MWVTGFEPAKALSHRILSPAYLTTLAHPQNKKITKELVINLAIYSYLGKIIVYENNVYSNNSDIEIPF